MSTPVRSRSIAQRFWAKVRQRGAGCWEWSASLYPSGYGQFRVGATGEGMAHRWAWRLTRGHIPPGKHVLHRCDNRRCCRPDHLFLGTAKQNAADMIAKHRLPRGEQRAWAKLTPTDVRQVRGLYWIGKPYGTKYADLVDLFRVSAGTIGRIVRREKWRHVA